MPWYSPLRLSVRTQRLAEGWRALHPLSSISRPSSWAVIILDVVVIHRFPPNVTVVDEDDHHTLENAPTCLPSLRDLLADRLHADVGRELPLTPRRIDSSWRKGTFQSGREWVRRLYCEFFFFLWWTTFKTEGHIRSKSGKIGINIHHGSKFGVSI